MITKSKNGSTSLRVQKACADRWARAGGEHNYHASQLCRYGVLPELIEKAELTQGVSVLADKGYCSKKNSACLFEHGLIDGIMLKVQKGMKLTERQREFNNLISKTRCLIERTCGSIRRWFSGGRCRYRGLERTHTQNILEAMAYNLKRMPGLLVLQSSK